MFAYDSNGQSKLITEQQKALNRYFKNGESLSIILKDFIWQSGLLEKVAQTFLLDTSDLLYLYNTNT